MADISKERAIESPFGYSDLLSRVRENALLNILNQELARPVNPEDSEVEYVPTQYLAEVILDLGYDGIRYRSAVRNGGTNFVFFHPNDLIIEQETHLVEVVSIDVKYRWVWPYSPPLLPPEIFRRMHRNHLPSALLT